MRVRSSLWLGGIVLAISLFGRTAGANTQSEIEAAYAGIARAVVERNVAGFMSFLAPDVEWRYPDGTVQRRAEIEAIMKSFILTRPASRVFRFKVLSLKKQQDDVVSEAIMQEGNTRYARTDTWRRSPSGWKNTIGFESVLPN
jgi:hypothetical protein